MMLWFCFSLNVHSMLLKGKERMDVHGTYYPMFNTIKKHSYRILLHTIRMKKKLLKKWGYGI